MCIWWRRDKEGKEGADGEDDTAFMFSLVLVEGVCVKERHRNSFLPRLPPIAPKTQAKAPERRVGKDGVAGNGSIPLGPTICYLR